MSARSVHAVCVWLTATIIGSACSFDKQWSDPASPAASDSASQASSWSPSAVFSAGKRRKAEKEAERVKSLLALARLSEKRQQHDRAVKLYNRAIEMSPENPLPYHRLAVIRARRGQHEQATEYFAEAVRRDAENVDLLVDVGYHHYLRGDLDQAEHHFRRALKLEPENARCCNNLGMVLGEQQRYAEAMELFRRGGSAAEAQANIALVYAQQGDVEKAIESYSRSLEIDKSMRPAAEALVQLAPYGPQPEQRLTFRDLDADDLRDRRDRDHHRQREEETRVANVGVMPPGGRYGVTPPFPGGAPPQGENTVSPDGPRARNSVRLVSRDEQQPPAPRPDGQRFPATPGVNVATHPGFGDGMFRSPTNEGVPHASFTPPEPKAPQSDFYGRQSGGPNAEGASPRGPRESRSQSGVSYSIGDEHDLVPRRVPGVE